MELLAAENPENLKKYIDLDYNGSLQIFPSKKTML